MTILTNQNWQLQLSWVFTPLLPLCLAKKKKSHFQLYEI